jgi:SAM-dependent methyltransferase
LGFVRWRVSRMGISRQMGLHDAPGVIRRAELDEQETLGLGLTPGALHYRAYVGWPQNYDVVAAMTFNFLTALGLRQHHTLIDVGCGSLRTGRLLIPYLNAGKYVGIEPNRWLVEDGIAHEVGDDLVRIKRPAFFFSDSPGVLAGIEDAGFALAVGVFSHCGPEILEDWLSAIARALASDGALLATFRLGDEDCAGTGWCYPDAVHYTRATMERMAADAGLRLFLPGWSDPVRTWAVFYKPGYDTQRVPPDA